MFKNKKGFTLLEVLLVVAIIAILAGIVILALNPSKQLSDSRNAQRKADVNTILNAVYQYSIDNSGTLPAGVTSTSTAICRTGAATSSCADLSVLTASEKYLTAVPMDPSLASSSATVGYNISKSANNRVTVNATEAENSVVITATR